MPVSTYLKERTAQLHQRTEQAMLSDALMNGALTPEAYRWLIETLYIFHAMAEETAMARATEIIGRDVDLMSRQKTPWLRDDAERLSIAPPRCEPVTVDSDLEALGWWYVMEGATLGGQFVVRRLDAVPSLASFRPFRYYSGYGPETGRQWSQFRGALDAAITESQYGEVLRGAADAYEALIGLAARRSR